MGKAGILAAASGPAAGPGLGLDSSSTRGPTTQNYVTKERLKKCLTPGLLLLTQVLPLLLLLVPISLDSLKSSFLMA